MFSLLQCLQSGNILIYIYIEIQQPLVFPSENVIEISGILGT